jgi:hypothetical protein
MACREEEAKKTETPAEKLDRLNYALVEMNAKDVLKRRSDPNWYAFGRAEYLSKAEVTCYVLHTRSAADHHKWDIHAVLEMDYKPDWHSKDDLSFSTLDWQRYCEKTKWTGKDFSIQLNQHFMANTED